MLKFIGESIENTLGNYWNCNQKTWNNIWCKFAKIEDYNWVNAALLKSDDYICNLKIIYNFPISNTIVKSRKNIQIRPRLVRLNIIGGEGFSKSSTINNVSRHAEKI